MSKVKQKYNKKNEQYERGSVFFYILLAIMLFAALSYAVSNDRDNSTDIFTEEQAKIAAQEIVEYGNTVANAVQKLRIRGCTETQINFANSVIAGYSTVGAPPDGSCDVFDVNGGNINAPIFGNNTYASNPPSINPVSFNGDNQVINVGSAEAELVAFVSDIRQPICESINNILHGDSTPFTDTNLTAGSTKFNGSYNGSPQTICDGTADSTTAGCCHETTGCNAGACYHFYQVLITR